MGKRISADDSLKTIEAATVPAGPLFFTPGTLRQLGQATRTEAIRKLLKYVRVKGVSVRKATGSMCYWTYVDLPRVEHTHYAGQSWDICATCQRERAAREKVEGMILAAFPDLDDRSDGMTDYSDFVFMVGNK